MRDKSKSLLLAVLIGSVAFPVLAQATSQKTNSQQTDQLSAAKKQLEECQSIYRSGGPDAAPRALVKGLDAQQLFAIAGDKSGEAFSLTWIGYLYGELGSRPKAIEAYVKAVTLFHDLGDGRNEADALSSLGYTYILESQQAKGFNDLNEALAL